jgi:hypothetical protein
LKKYYAHLGTGTIGTETEHPLYRKNFPHRAEAQKSC